MFVQCRRISTEAVDTHSPPYIRVHNNTACTARSIFAYTTFCSADDFCNRRSQMQETAHNNLFGIQVCHAQTRLQTC